MDESEPMAAVDRTPGRPQAAAANPDARATLIQTAAELFAQQGFEGTSLRAVAVGAGVTPAMVAYYFKDKAGLLEAVVREGLGVLLEVVRGVVADHETGRFVPLLVERYLATIARAPWIPQVMIREVISRDSPLRQVFINEFAAHAASLVPEQVAREIRAGTLRRDLDPRFAILSVLGMCLFPFIAHPVLGDLLGYELDDDFGAAYGAHVLTLFSEGAAR